MKKTTHSGLRHLAGLLAASALALVASQAVAQDGTCPPNIRKELETNLTSSAEIVEAGQKLYAANCASCHGDKGMGDGPAAVALNPKPRNFTKEQFQNGSDPLGIFKTLNNGLNQGMPSFDSLPEKDRWALVHFVREGLMPEDKRAKVDMNNLDEICIRVAEERNRQPPIPVNLAMQIMVEEATANNKQARDFGGVVKLSQKIAGSDGKVESTVLEEGKALYGSLCASCHGDKGEGKEGIGNYGRAPYLHLATLPLTNQDAAGTWSDFSTRAALGDHYTLSDMTLVSALSEEDWFTLQAYVASFQGGAEVTNDAPPAAPTALIFSGEGYDIYTQGGKFYQLVTNAEGDQAPVSEISDYQTFRKLYTSAELPEDPSAAGVQVPGFVGLSCVGQRDASGDATPGCKGQDTSAVSPTQINISLPVKAEE